MEQVLQAIDRVIVQYNNYVGGYALLFLLIPAGLYFAVRFNFLQIRKLPYAFRVIAGKYDVPGEKGEISHFRALTTALSATVGTGNIVGVALAIYYGGPGAVFWMWITGILGMILKMVEATLSLKYRRVHEDGTVSGGPMYYMEHGLKSRIGYWAKILAVIFAIATMLSALGQGNMAQSNSIADALQSNYNMPPWISGVILTTLVLLVIVGGIRRIAQVTSKLVPFMAALYFIGAITVLIMFYQQIPAALWRIVHDAFSGTAAKGGFIGSTFIMTLTWGVRRGIFSNEAGQGSAAIAFSASRTRHPVRVGLVASLGPLFDTLFVCTLTALVIIITDTWSSGIKGVYMTVEGFDAGLSPLALGNIGEHVVAIGLVLFAFSTMISWSYYGSKATEYILGPQFIKPYRVLFGVFVFFGSVWGIDLVWHFVDMAVSLMTIPNLIAIFLLASVFAGEVKSYFSK